MRTDILLCGAPSGTKTSLGAINAVITAIGSRIAKGKLGRKSFIRRSMS